MKGNRGTLISITTIFVIFSAVSANIWDNLFSQYTTPLVPLTAPKSMKFELQEFSLLMPIFLRVDYYGPENSIAFTLGRENTDAGQVVLDFKNSYAKLQAIDEKGTVSSDTCVFYNLPTAMRADITDLNNLLRYFAFEEKPTDAYTNTKNYRLNLLGLESRLIPFTNSSLPKIQLKLQKNMQNQFTRLSVQIGDTELTLQRSQKDLSAEQPPAELTPLDRLNCAEADGSSNAARHIVDTIGRNLLGSELGALISLT